MGRCVAVGGADINNYGFIREKLCADDYVIFCDSGLKHLENLQVHPRLIVGDFDSHENPTLIQKPSFPLAGRMIPTLCLRSKKPRRVCRFSGK